MKILKNKKVSKCTDQSLVFEFELDCPITHPFITFLKQKGELNTKELGGTCLFTFQYETWISIKGMVDDTILFITFRKEDLERIHALLDTLMEEFSQISAL